MSSLYNIVEAKVARRGLLFNLRATLRSRIPHIEVQFGSRVGFDGLSLFANGLHVWVKPEGLYRLELEREECLFVGETADIDEVVRIVKNGDNRVRKVVKQ